MQAVRPDHTVTLGTELNAGHANTLGSALHSIRLPVVLDCADLR